MSSFGDSAFLLSLGIRAKDLTGRESGSDRFFEDGMTAVSTRGLFRDRRLLALFSAESISTTGSRMTALALPWFVLTTTGSATRMSFIVASQVGANALFGLPSGLSLARLGARRTMLIADSLRAPIIFVVPLLFWLGSLRYSELLVLAFIVGALSAPYGAAQRLLMAELLEDDPTFVAQANALFQGAQRTTVILGPSLAGALITVIGAPWVLVVDTATFAIAVALIAVFVPRPSLVGDRREQSVPRLLDGLRYFRQDKLLAKICGALVVGDGMYTAIFLAIPVLVFASFSAHAWLAGLFLGSWGAGAVVGNVVAYRRLRGGASFRLMAVFFVAQALPLCLLAFPVPALALAGVMAGSGIGNGLANPTLHSMMTLRPPTRVRGSVLTAFFTSSAVGMPIAVVAAGVLFKPLGSRLVLGIATSALVCVGAYVAVAFLRSERNGSSEQRGSTELVECNRWREARRDRAD